MNLADSYEKWRQKRIEKLEKEYDFLTELATKAYDELEILRKREHI